MSFRATVIHFLYRAFPFSLKGDVKLDSNKPSCKISCIINFYKRLDLLEGILFSLAEQTMDRSNFEIILVEDRGGTSEGAKLPERFGSLLRIRYFALTDHFGKMGFSRNFGLEKARGQYVLFLDDDTVILQQDFLQKLLAVFQETKADAVIPHGSSSYFLMQDRYGYHDPYFPTSRCMAYSRDALRELAGFVGPMTGQEDVEFIIRYIASGREYYQSSQLNYLHPPFLISKQKAAAVGASFAVLRNRYPLLVWLMLLVNGCRFLPFLFVPLSHKHRMQGLFSLGFLSGFVSTVFRQKEIRYE